MILKRFTYPVALLFAAVLLFAFALLGSGCTPTPEAESISGVKMTSTTVQTDPTDGQTVEQRNIKERIKRDNAPGSIKFLYLISPFTGDVIYASTVKGKVTSSGKRLTPADIAPYVDGSASDMVVHINGKAFVTNQTPGDDGTYGDSIPYLYWYDQKGTYHQQYLGAAIIHITDAPMTVKKTTQAIEPAKG